MTRSSGIHGSMEPDREKPQKTFPELSSLPGLYIKLSSEEPYIVGTKMSLGFLFYTRLCISLCFVLFCSFELKFSTKYRNPFCIKKCMEQTESNTNFKRLSNPVKVVYICLRTFNFNLDTSNRKIQYISLI